MLEPVDFQQLLSTINLTTGNDFVVLDPNVNETLTVPSGSSGIDFVSNFRQFDKIDITAYPSLTAEMVLSTGQELGGGVRLIGPFGQLTLQGISQSQLNADNFITTENLLPPEITASLVNDTGISNGDRITSDPTIAGTITNVDNIVSFRASLGGDFVDVSAELQPDGTFEFSQTRLASINNRRLRDDDYTLEIVAEDLRGNVSNVLQLPFTLDTTEPELAVSFPTPQAQIRPGDRLTGTVDEDLTELTYRFDSASEVPLNADSGAFDAELDLSEIAIGPQTLRVTATDIAGNIATTNLGVEVRGEDETPPLIIVSLANDTGTSNADGITSDPTITGRVTDVSEITAFRARFNGNFVDISDRVQADGRFELNRPLLTAINGGSLNDGIYRLQLVAEDLRGNVSNVFQGPFTLDTAAPTLALTSPTENSRVLPGEELTGTVADANFDQLSYRFGSASEVPVTVSPGQFNARLDVSNVETGVQTLRVTAGDLAGNLSTTDVTVDVREPDNVPPLITASLAEDTGVSDADGITTNPTIRGTVSDGNEITALQASLGGNVVDVAVELEADGSFELNRELLAAINGSPLIDGNYTLQLSARDDFDNVSNSFEVSFTLDTAEPDLVIASPTPNDEVQLGSRLVGTANETLSELSYRFNNNNSVPVTVFEGAFNTELDVGELTLGTQTLSVTATDLAGNVATTDLEVELREADRRPPLINATLANDTGTSSTDRITSDPTIVGTVTDASDISAFRASLGGDFIDISVQRQVDGSFELDLDELQAINRAPLADGTYTLQLEAEDSDGNLSNLFDVSFILDTTEPMLAISEPVVNDVVTPGDRLAGTVNESLAGLSYRFTNANEVPVTVNSGAFDTELNVNESVFGEQTLSVTATDLAGNVATTSLAVNVREDDSRPPLINAGLANDTGTSNNDGITSDPMIVGTVDDASTITSFRASLGGNFLDISSQRQADGSFELELDELQAINGGALSDGSYTLQLEAEDEFDNLSNIFEVSFVLDRADPVLAIASPTQNAMLMAGDRLSGTVNESLAGLSYRFNNSTEVAVSVEAGEFDEQLDLEGLDMGSQTLNVTATDLAGNVAISSLTVVS